MKTIKGFMLTALVSVAMLSCKPAQTQASGDGSSYENAIVVKSVGEEYAIIKKLCSGCRVTSQVLSENKSKYYDILNVQTPEGREVRYYFDINSFYGKW